MDVVHESGQYTITYSFARSFNPWKQQQKDTP